MRWDIFCTVIDNFGDVGVCWRLACDLASRGHTCCLWLDDDRALRWMAPEVGRDGCGHPGVTVRPWAEASCASAPDLDPGDVVIEAFGCNPPDAFVARMPRPTPPVWINLEYLSAESYVERSHSLRSPVFSGPAAGLHKWFYYPGFTPRTGGLLREPDLLARRDALQSDPARRREALARLGVTDWQPDDLVVSVFCYDRAPLPALLDQLQAATTRHPVPRRAHVLLTPGPAQALASTWTPPPGSRVHLHALPAVAQRQFDTPLWLSDLNIVRGEDSAVRALWAARPHLWHIYEQDDGVHADKLDAFLTPWLADAPAGLRTGCQALWRAFNGLGPEADLACLGDLLSPPLWAQWQQLSHAGSERLSGQADLTTRLLQFVMNPG